MSLVLHKRSLTLQITVDNLKRVHVLQREENLSSIESVANKQRQLETRF